MHFDSFCNCAFDLSRKSGHICNTATINDAYFLGAETFCSTDSIHRNISATDNSNFLSGKIRILFFADITEELHCGKNTVSMFTFDTKLFIGTCTDRDKYGIILFAKALNGHIFTDSFAVDYFHTGLENCIDIIIKTIFRKTIVRNAIAEHTAELRKHLEHGCLVTHKLQIISRT